MSDTLFPYYERELIFIRQFAQEFAARYPAAAGRLLLEPNRSGDPHVERMIESFALLAGRIHHKLDDEFPELTEALLGVLYPHYLAPVPSMSLVAVRARRRRAARCPTAFTSPAAAGCKRRGWAIWPANFAPAIRSRSGRVELTHATRAIAAVSARIRAAAADGRGAAAAIRVPVGAEILAAFAGRAAALSVRRRAPGRHALRADFQPCDASGLPLARTGPEAAADRARAGRMLGASRVRCRRRACCPIPPAKLFGLSPAERIFRHAGEIPVRRSSRVGGKAAAAGFQRKIEVVVFLNHTVPRVEEWVDRDDVPPRLHAGRESVRADCRAGRAGSGAIRISRRRPTWRSRAAWKFIRSTRCRASIRPLRSRPSIGRSTRSIIAAKRDERHDVLARLAPQLRRKKATAAPRCSCTWSTLEFQPQLPADDTLVVRTTCTNRDLPNQLQHAGERLYFELEGAAPLAGIRCLKTPDGRRCGPPAARGRYWSLVSHLTLNYLSLADPVQGRDALCEILRLYDFSDPQAGQQQLADVTRQLIEGHRAASTRGGSSAAPAASRAAAFAAAWK